MYNHSRMGSRMDLFGQLWKEYALSDSRYMHSDPFVLCMETWTAVGILKSPPLHLLTASDNLGAIIILDSCAYHQGLSLQTRKQAISFSSGLPLVLGTNSFIGHPSPCFDRSILR